jgi:uncharacterized membrane protein YdjX (TVP38/TMEM64 family)
MTTAAFILLVYGKHIQDTLVLLLDWTRGLGWMGPFVMGLAYVPFAVLLLPGSILTLSAGFLFGLWKGTLVAILGSTLGATAAFLVGRAAVHDWVDRKIGSKRAFRAIADAVSCDGLKVVLLVRLSPVFPFNILNYAFSITKVQLWRYIVGSLMGMLPGTILFVYIGTTARSLAAITAGDVDAAWAKEGFLFFGLGAAFFVSVLVTYKAHKALKRAVEREGEA